MKEIKLTKLDEVIYYDKAKNGLEIYMLVNERVNNYYATLNVRYGSIDTKFKVLGKEYNVPNGVAHFLEHVNFNEEDGATADDYFNKFGSSINASTSFDFTNYEVFGTDDIISNVTHLLDYVETPVFTKELVEKEKGIIVEEYNMDKNNPSNVFYYANNRVLFHNNKRINYIVGNEEDIKSISSDDLKLVYNNFYHPSNMYMVITGNFNPYEVALAIKENQDKKKFIKFNKPKVIYDKEDVSVVKDYQEIKSNVEIPKVSVSYKMNRKDFKNIESDFLLSLYLNIILSNSFGPTSEFRESLLEKNLVTSISARSSIIDDFVIIRVILETKYPNEIIDIIKDNMNKLKINKETLIRKVKTNIAYLIASFDDIEDVNSTIAYEVLKYGGVINNRYNLIKNINLEEANYVIKHINLKNVCVLVQSPKDK